MVIHWSKSYIDLSVMEGLDGIWWGQVDTDEVESSAPGWQMFPPLLAAYQPLCPGAQWECLAVHIWYMGKTLLSRYEFQMLFKYPCLWESHLKRSVKSLVIVNKKDRSTKDDTPLPLLHYSLKVHHSRLILWHPRLQARLLPRVAKLPRQSPRGTKRKGWARGRSPLPSTSTRLYRLDMSKTLRILIYIQFQVVKQVHPGTGVSSMSLSIMNSLRWLLRG